MTFHALVERVTTRQLNEADVRLKSDAELWVDASNSSGAPWRTK